MARLYVEALIRADLDDLWRRTQDHPRPSDPPDRVPATAPATLGGLEQP